MNKNDDVKVKSESQATKTETGENATVSVPIVQSKHEAQMPDLEKIDVFVVTKEDSSQTPSETDDTKSKDNENAAVGAPAGESVNGGDGPIVENNTNNKENSAKTSPNTESSDAKPAEKLDTNSQDPKKSNQSGIFPSVGVHPLFRRVLLGSTQQKPLLPLFAPPKTGLLGSLFNFQQPMQRKKKHVKRATKEEDIVKPKPFRKLEVDGTTTRRPTLFERFHAMDSAERAEKVSKILEKIMHGVTIVGHVDGYLTNRAREGIRKLHKLLEHSEEKV